MSIEQSSGSAYLHAKAANESIKAQKTKRQLTQLEKNYIDRLGVEQLVFQRIHDSRNRWLLWADEVAPILSEKLGVEEHLLRDLIHRGVLQHLKELGDFSFSLSDDVSEEQPS